MSEEMKPCPFCGISDRNNHKDDCYVELYGDSRSDCSGEPSSEDEFDKAWNTRSEQAAKQILPITASLEDLTKLSKEQ